MTSAQDALTQLPEQQREALRLVAWDGLSQAEAVPVVTDHIIAWWATHSQPRPLPSSAAQQRVLAQWNKGC